MRRVFLTICMLFALLAQPSTSDALQTALDTAQPGDVIELPGGLYAGAHVCRVAGTVNQPITLTNAPGAHVVIDQVASDGSVSGPALDFTSPLCGGYVTIESHGSGQIEVLNSNPDRWSDVPGSDPPITEVGGRGIYDEMVSVRAPGIKLINLLIHDGGDGVGTWSQAPASDYYGLTIYNNGWESTDRGHGHGMYVQNSGTEKRIGLVSSGNNYGNAIAMYGSSAADVKNITVSNSTFYNGRFLLTPGRVSSGMKLRGNTTYNSQVQIGDGGLTHDDIVVTGNSFIELNSATAQQVMAFAKWSRVIFTDNTLVRIGLPDLLLNYTQAISQTTTWDRNTYQNQTIKPWSFGYNGVKNFADWKAATGFDAGSTHTNTATAQTRVYGNAYDVDRALLIAFNPSGAASISFDLTQLPLTYGRSYAVHNAQNWDQTLAFVYDGSPLVVPTSGWSAALPIGAAAAPYPASMPTFGAWVVTP